MSLPGNPPDARPAPRVVVVDDDRDIAELMRSVLVDEGYEVTLLHHDPDPEKLRVLLAGIQADCVLLDSVGRHEGFGESWKIAAWLSDPDRDVPVVMVTAYLPDVEEAKGATSVRARLANFAAIVAKPFDLDELLQAVSRATKRSEQSRATTTATRARISQITERLRGAGARDISSSSRRAWLTFRTPAGELMQLYLWEAMSVYFLGRYTPDGTRMEPLGEFTELDAAIALALPSRQT